MALHSDTWYRNQNLALGLPAGERHSDTWYQNETLKRQQQAKAAQEEQWRLERLAKEQQNQAYIQQRNTRQSADEAARIAAEKAAADKAAADKIAADKIAADKIAADKVIADQTAAENTARAQHLARQQGWDRMHKQRGGNTGPDGAYESYDPDGWQSIGHQPDYIAMPSWWDGPGTVPGAAPPATPPVTPAVTPAVTPPVTPPVAPPVTSPVAPPPLPAPGDLLNRPEPTGAPFTGFGPAPGNLLNRPEPTGAPFTGFAAPAPTNSLAQLLGGAGQGTSPLPSWMQTAAPKAAAPTQSWTTQTKPISSFAGWSSPAGATKTSWGGFGDPTLALANNWGSGTW